jgi:hypothetical protein
MSSRDHMVRQPAVKPNRKLSWGRLSAYLGLSLCALALAGAVLIFVFSGPLLDGYGKRKAERAFAKAHPGSVLQIGKLDYSVGARRLSAQSVTLSAPNSTLKIGGLSLTGVRWARLLWGNAALADVLAKASFEATNLDVEFPEARYGIRCARLHASVPASELIAEGTELRTLVGDEEFFAAHTFRTTRFCVTAPECRVLGLEYRGLLQGKSYRAKSIQLSRLSFDALVDREKPVEPFVRPPLMLPEALAAIRQPLQVDSLSITNAHLKYGERVVAGADPGVLTFAVVNLSVEGLANRGDASAAIRLQGQGELMEAGVLKLLMTIPINSPDFSLHYSGSLNGMDLTRLDPFLDIAEHTRIKSGSAQGVAFEIDVAAGQARGRVRAIYRDLVIAVLGKQTGTEKGLSNRVTSFLANALKIRNANAPDSSGALREGKVDYARRPEDEFLQFVWFALRSGVLDVISL